MIPKLVILEATVKSENINEGLESVEDARE
jgi:hypothetical protein